jgi:hypothetical protein
MDTIKQCFQVILQGKKEQSRQAARYVHKLVYSSASQGEEKCREISKVLEHAPQAFAAEMMFLREDGKSGTEA